MWYLSNRPQSTGLMPQQKGQSKTLNNTKMIIVNNYCDKKNTDQGRRFPKFGNFWHRRGSDFEHNVRLKRVTDNLGTCSFVVGITEFGFEASVFFYVYLERYENVKVFFGTLNLSVWRFLTKNWRWGWIYLLNN